MIDTKDRTPPQWHSTRCDLIVDGKGEETSAAAARNLLLQRYHKAVGQYFLLQLGNADVARELYARFAVRVLENDKVIHNFDPSKGKFRHYLQRVLWNMIRDYYRERGRDLPPLETDAAESRRQADLDSVWKLEILNHVWLAMERFEQEQRVKHPERLSYTVLRFKADHEHLRSADLARKLSAKLGRTFTEENIRQILHRARKRFAGFLVSEIAKSLGSRTTPEEVADEVRKLNLLDQCQEALSDYEQSARGD